MSIKHSTCPAFSFSRVLWVAKLAWPGIQEYINEIHRKQAVREERLGKQPCLLLTGSICPLHLEQHGKRLWPILSESILLHPGYNIYNTYLYRETDRERLTVWAHYNIEWGTKTELLQEKWVGHSFADFSQSTWGYLSKKSSEPYRLSLWSTVVSFFSLK